MIALRANGFCSSNDLLGLSKLHALSEGQAKLFGIILGEIQIKELKVL